MKTIINWTRFYGDNKPDGFGWFVVILKPSNYQELELSNRGYTAWIKEFGFDLVWYGSGDFWDVEKNVHEAITDRVLYYARRPSGLLLEGLDE